MAFYKKRIVRPDTMQDIQERLRRNAVLEQVKQEMKDRFPTITADNFATVNDWREARIIELTKQPNGE